MVEYLAIGLMSGTSMDGIDAALLQTDGKQKIKELGSVYLSYDKHFHLLLKAAEFIVGHHHGDLAKAEEEFLTDLKHYFKQELKFSDDDLEYCLTTLSKDLDSATISLKIIISHLTYLHANAVKLLLNKYDLKAEKINVIGFHGQTLYHNPAAKQTLQIGDGLMLARLTQIKVINNFRENDVKHGGQGAPFAPLYHQALALRDEFLPLVVVNCGGITNLTIISGKTLDDVLGYDSGPGNALLDQYVRMQTKGKETMDKDGKFSKAGSVDQDILEQLFQTSCTKNNKNYYQQSFPKSLDVRDIKLIPELGTLKFNDACKTLTEFTAKCVVDSYKQLQIPFIKTWVLAGGGWKNPSIVAALKSRLHDEISAEIQVYHAKDVGWDGDVLEAQLFAFLAVRHLINLPISAPSITGVTKAMTGGDLHEDKAYVVL